MFVVAAIFTVASAYAAGLAIFPALPLPRSIRLGLGAAILSLIVFLELVFGCGTRPLFLATGALCLLAGALRFNAVRHPVPPMFPGWLISIPFALYAVMYAVQAMAPEIQPDALDYHLGLTAEYARLHAFPARIGFYEVLPQGMEMLFTMAYSLGGGSAAKLVHFAFLLATIPLMLAVGAKLKIGFSATCLAALLYFAMPVAGIAGTSTYNDAALVFFALATFYAILFWCRDRRLGSLVVVGLLAGFCFAIKVTGLPMVAAAVLAVLVLTRRPLPVLLVAGAALLPMAPWILRALILTGNPAAPLLNAWFPNPFFNAASEALMAANLRAYEGFSWRDAPWEYAFRGSLQGIVGPLLYALPLALLSIRTRAGRLLLLASLVAFSPWFLNAGSRFLMPAVPFLALALCSSLPLFLLTAIAAIQVLLCWPPILQNFEKQHAWSFHEIPWRAAFRLEPEAVYLDRTIGEYATARLVEAETEPQDRVYCLMSIAKAYTTRDVAVHWYSTPDQQLADALETALIHSPMAQSSATFPSRDVKGVRVVAGTSASEEFRIFEVRLSLHGAPLPHSMASRMDASPNDSEAPLAFDDDRTTSWRARTSMERGMFLAALFAQPISFDQVEVTVPATLGSIPLVLQTQTDRDGPWRTIADALRVAPVPATDLRREATRTLSRAGFRFILVHAGDAGIDRIGDDMVKHPAEWGLSDRGGFAPVHLFRIE